MQKQLIQSKIWTSRYAELIWEYRGGELAIHATEDLFRKNKDVYKLQSMGKGFTDYLNRGADNKNIMQYLLLHFATSHYKAGFNEILKQIEQQCGFARGTLSDVSQVEKNSNRNYPC